MTRQEIAILVRLYQTRACWICQAARWCAHREPLVDLAEHTPNEIEKEDLKG